MQSAFSLYSPRNSGLHRLNPLTKLTLVLACIVLGLFSPTMWGAYALFLIVLIPLAAWGKILGPFLNAVWKLVLPFAISVFVIQGLFWTDGTPILSFGPLSVKQEGIQFAIVSTGRILALVSSFLLLSFSTRPDHLMISLSQRGAPDKLAYIILATIQIVPRFQAKASTILDAQQARGLNTSGGLIQRTRALLPLVEPLILGSLIDIDERAIALEARAFGRKAPKTFLLILPDPRREIILRWLILLATAVFLILRVILRLFPFS